MESYKYKDILIYHYREVSSTSDIIKELKGVHKKLVVWADTQRRGRGRKMRDWVSPLGGLWFTLLFSPQRFSKRFLPYIVKLSALSVLDLLKRHNIEGSIKPPNDIYVDGKKIAGILIDTEVKGENVEAIYIGIGLNVNNTMEDAPSDIKNIAITMHDVKGKIWSLEDLLHTLLDRIFLYFDLLPSSYEEIGKAYYSYVEKFHK